MTGWESLRRVLGAAIVAALLAVPLVATVDVLHSGPELRDLPFGVAGPPLVAQPVVERLDGLPGRPFDALVPASGSQASEVEALVADGRLEAAVVLDLSGERDRLLVRGTLSPAVVDEIEVAAQAVATSYGRELVVERVPPARSADAARRLPFGLVAGAALAGVVAAFGLSAWRGRVAHGPAGAHDGALRAEPTHGPGRRLLALAGVALLVGAVAGGVGAAGSDAAWLPLALTTAAICATTAWLALGLEALWGLSGIAVGAAFLGGTALPYLLGIDPATMPRPWSELAELSPHEAARLLVDDEVFGGAGSLQPWLLVAAWAAVGVVAVLAAARLRPTDEA